MPSSSGFIETASSYLTKSTLSSASITPRAATLALPKGILPYGVAIAAGGMFIAIELLAP